MTTRNIWVISDTHFNHDKIIEYYNRPFTSVQKMNSCMVERWNSVVRDGDYVYHLGDVYMGDREEADRILSKLNGSKRLVLGNHDDGKDKLLQRHFKKIMMWRMFPEWELLFSHVRLHPDCLTRGARQALVEPIRMVNVHGHTHNNDPKEMRWEYYNVCVENTEYTPIHIDTLIAHAKEIARVKKENKMWERLGWD